MRFVLRLLVSAASLWLAVAIVPRASFDGGIVDLLIVTVVFGLVNALIGPLLRLVTVPLTVMTLGLFAIIVNGLLVLITAAVSDSLSFDGGLITQLGAASLTAILLAIVSLVLTKLVPDRS